MLALSLVTKLRARPAGPPPAKPAPPSSVASVETRLHRPVDANGAMTRIVATTTPLGSVAPTVITTEFVYDARQQMVQAKLNDGRVVNQEYMPDSPLRLYFTASGAAPGGGAKTFQVWDPTTQNPLQDLDGSNALQVDYVMGRRMDQALARVAGGAMYAFVTDRLGSIRSLAGSAGAQVNRYDYAAFGLGRSQVEAIANRLRFTARELDVSTGLQFTRNRHYVASIGRFTQHDTDALPVLDPFDQPQGRVMSSTLQMLVEQGYFPRSELIAEFSNGYVYVKNRPVVLVDPTGQKSWCERGCWAITVACLTGCYACAKATCFGCPPRVPLCVACAVPCPVAYIGLGLGCEIYCNPPW